jgi:hypothetical protein
VLRADAGLHADPTRRQIGKSGLHLATRPFLPQHDGTALILARASSRRCIGGYQPTYVMIEGFSCILWCSDH